LALIKPDPKGLALEKISLGDAYNLVITARPRGSIPTQLWTSSYFIFIGGKS
jgi:hypothetical protein